MSRLQNQDPCLVPSIEVSSKLDAFLLKINKVPSLINDTFCNGYISPNIVLFIVLLKNIIKPVVKASAAFLGNWIKFNIRPKLREILLQKKPEWKG